MTRKITKTAAKPRTKINKNLAKASRPAPKLLKKTTSMAVITANGMIKPFAALDAVIDILAGPSPGERCKLEGLTEWGDVKCKTDVRPGASWHAPGGKAPVDSKQLLAAALFKIRCACGGSKTKLWIECSDYAGDWAYSSLTEKTVCLIGEAAARKTAWLEAAKQLRVPGSTLAAVFDQVEGYSHAYAGNPTIPEDTPPAKLAAWAWKVRHRAAQILKPYNWSPSNRAVAAAIVSRSMGRDTSIGKAAVKVAAASLPVVFGTVIAAPERGCNEPLQIYNTYLAGRNTLIKARGWASLRRRWAHDEPVFNAIMSGVKEGLSIAQAEREATEVITGSYELDEAGFVQGAAIYSKQGITVKRCWGMIRHRVWDGWSWMAKPNVAESMTMSRTVVVSAPGRKDYHGQGNDWYGHAQNMKGIIGEAISAWHKAEAAENLYRKKNKELIDFLTGQKSNSCPLFTIADSRAVGNCETGTRYWQTKNSLPGNILGGAALIPHLDDQRVRSIIAKRMSC